MTIIIKSIFASRSQDCIGVDVEISNGENSERRVFKLLSSQYATLAPKKGEISEEFYEILNDASKYCEAYLKAINILSFAPCTEKALVLKLRRRGFEASLASDVARTVREKGYISDSDNVEREVERCLAKKWGPRRIIMHLRSKGYDDDTVILAEDSMENVDFRELCFQLARKRYDSVPKDPSERQKMIASLARYGYSMDEIRYALSNF